MEFNFQSGDSVRLRLAKNVLDGIILESSDSSVVLLKLSSGYNIGIPKENILAGRVLKKFKSETKELEIPEKNPSLKTIGLIVTGGTIASKLDAKTGGVSPLTDVGVFAKYYPELFNIVNVGYITPPINIKKHNVFLGN